MKQHNRIAIIPAAGKGVRLGALGTKYPKCLLPYNDQPLIMHTIAAIREHVDEIYVVAENIEHELWRIVLDKEPKVNLVQFKLVEGVTSPSVPASILCAWESIGVDYAGHLLLVFSDAAYLDVDYAAVCQHNSLVCMFVEDHKRWTLTVTGEGGLIHFEEKPETAPECNFLAFAGIANIEFTQQFMSTLFQGAGQHVEHCEFSIAIPLQKYQDWLVKERDQQWHEVVIERGTFLDFGTLESFKENRGLSKCRMFNSVEVYENVVKKASSDKEKIYREATWMRYCPPFFRDRVPTVVSFDPMLGTLEMQRIKSETLREVMLYVNNDRSFWKPVFEDLWDCFNYMKSTQNQSGNFWDGLCAKNDTRATKLHVFSQQRALDRLTRLIRSSKMASGTSVYHGDPNASNLFFIDGKLSFVDPRGEIWGHWLHDVAKAMMSFCYYYDHIDGELYTIEGKNCFFYDIGYRVVQETFREVVLSRLTEEELSFANLVCASLFLSSIPLHAHNAKNQLLYYRTGLEIVSTQTGFRL